MTLSGGDDGPATSIADVLSHLETIKSEASRQRSKIGYFAAVYLRITQTVKRRLDEGGFLDPDWVTKLDVTFANRYLRAVAQFRAGQLDCRSWQLAFDAASLHRPVILQHVLLGINAHINFDLGIATAQCASPSLSEHEQDFDTVNKCAAVEVASLQNRLGRLSPLIRVFDEVNGKAADGTVVNFGIDRARDQAWEVAELLTCLPQSQHAAQLRVLDRSTTALGRLMLDPPGLVPGFSLRLVRATEIHRVPSVIARL
jgi:hypothetical protein